MALWKRKQERSTVVEKSAECQHLWRDFPWCIHGTYTTEYGLGKLVVKIEETYICVKCKKRKEVILEEADYSRPGLSIEKAHEIIEAYKKKYEGRWAEKAVIEDMITDFQLVDRQALQWLGYIKKFGQENGITLTLERSNGEKYQVKLEEENNA